MLVAQRDRLGPALEQSVLEQLQILDEDAATGAELQQAGEDDLAHLVVGEPLRAERPRDLEQEFGEAVAALLDARRAPCGRHGHVERRSEHREAERDRDATGTAGAPSGRVRRRWPLLRVHGRSMVVLHALASVLRTVTVEPRRRTPLLGGTNALAAVPGPVLAVLRAIEVGGGRAWLVGGTARDLLLGLVPRDWDVATDLVPERVLELFPGAGERDRRFGATRLDDDPPIVVTTLRTEGDYADRRHPTTVTFVTEPEQDAARRDFTVNALYLDVRGVLLDPARGIPDLEQGVLRAIGEPARRFDEDALRLLRAIRFAARLSLAIESSTSAAIRAAAPNLTALSPERVFTELTAAFAGPGRGRALRLLVETGLADVVLPECAAMAGVEQPPQFHPEGDVLTHVGLVLDHVPEGDPTLAWAAVLHDVGKPPTFRRAEDRIRFDGHDIVSARMADAVLQRLRAPRDLREAVVEICRDHIRFASLPQMRPRRRETWMRSPRFGQHLRFHCADCLGSHGDLSIHDQALAEWQGLPPAPPSLVSGTDVLALGVPAGPLVGALLREVHDRLDGEDAVAATRERALSLLRELVARSFKRDSGKDDSPPG